MAREALREPSMEIVRYDTMKLSIRQRRVVALVVVISALMVWLAGAHWIDTTLGRPEVYSGATLLACLVGLMAIGMRKRLVVLPLWSVSTWVQVHIYTGLFACIVFAFHVPAIVANGVFEGGLSIMFLVVAASGVYGVFLSRTVPKRLTALSSQPRFDRIQWHRNQLAVAASDIIGELADTPDRSVVVSFFDQSLQPYFASSLSTRYLLFPSTSYRRKLLAELMELDRYLNSEVQLAAKRLAALIRHRDDLDYQNALQFRLRAWVVIHGSLSVLLIVWSLVHAYLAIWMHGR